jgi:hypothetical protein
VDLRLGGASRRQIIWGTLGALILVIVGYGVGRRDGSGEPGSSDRKGDIRSQRVDSAMNSVLDELSAVPRDWDVTKGPDAGSTMHLTTKCVAGSLYYRFLVLASRNLMARYRRTMPLSTQKDAIFTINLFDSAGFKISAVGLTKDQLLIESEDSEGHEGIYASDRVPITCLEYRSIQSWNPSWRLVER